FSMKIQTSFMSASATGLPLGFEGGAVTGGTACCGAPPTGPATGAVPPGCGAGAFGGVHPPAGGFALFQPGLFAPSTGTGPGWCLTGGPSSQFGFASVFPLSPVSLGLSLSCAGGCGCGCGVADEESFDAPVNFAVFFAQPTTRHISTPAAAI